MLQQVVEQGALTTTDADHIQFLQVQLGACYRLALVRDLNLSGWKRKLLRFAQLMEGEGTIGGGNPQIMRDYVAFQGTHSVQGASVPGDDCGSLGKAAP